MAQYLSEDLRIRVIGAIEGGMSRNGVARRFGVSIASAVRWMEEYLRTGRTAPKPRGGDRRSGRIEAQADLLMRTIEETACRCLTIPSPCGCRCIRRHGKD